MSLLGPNMPQNFVTFLQFLMDLSNLNVFPQGLTDSLFGFVADSAMDFNDNFSTLDIFWLLSLNITFFLNSLLRYSSQLGRNLGYLVLAIAGSLLAFLSIFLLNLMFKRLNLYSLSLYNDYL